jgi:L-fucose mutarotase/ribose pyranase (RbsD/FucU family)
MKRRQKIILIALMACFGFFLSACESTEKEDEEGAEMAMSWEQKLLKELPALGHRNWIVVADSAYPAQISPGIEIVVSNEDHFAVLEKVLKAIDRSKHIRPRIYLDKELAFVPEDLAPGIEACREKLDMMLKGREVALMLHEELIARLDQVAKTFRVLIIKTTLALPYTSVFMELDCGYWTPEAEAKMREKMK